MRQQGSTSEGRNSRKGVHTERCVVLRTQNMTDRVEGWSYRRKHSAERLGLSLGNRTLKERGKPLRSSRKRITLATNQSD